MPEPVLTKEFLPAAAFALSVLFAFPAAYFKTEVLRRLSGAFLIFSLATLSSNAFVCSLAIILVATLITDLEFLENIAAILWRNEKFWDYRKATQQDVEDKFRSEVAEERKEKDLAPSTAPPPSDAMRTRIADMQDRFKAYMAFQNAAIRTLTSANLLGVHDYLQETRIDAPGGRFILDAVGKGTNCDYVIEVKAAGDAHSVVRAYAQLRQYLDAYKRTLSPLHRVRGVIITPHSTHDAEIQKLQSAFGFLVGILLFDSAAYRFTNDAEFQKWLKLAKP